MSDRLTENILAVLASVKRIPREQITIDSRLEDLRIDSLDTIVLVSELEEKFHICIPDEQVRAIRNVRDIVERVRSLVDNGPLGSAAMAG
jgi:acyl carrier protein